MFITMEDETSIANLIIWPDNVEKFRPTLIASQVLGVDGIVQREGEVIHLLVDDAENLTPLLGLLEDPDAQVARQINIPSRNFH